MLVLPTAATSVLRKRSARSCTRFAPGFRMATTSATDAAGMPDCEPPSEHADPKIRKSREARLPR